MLVAVTHFDAYYDEDSASSQDRNPTALETKQQLAEVGSTTTHIQPKNVFPICSRWALTGRIASQPGRATRKQLAFLQYALSLYASKIGKENDNWSPEIGVDASGILDMEKRYEDNQILYFC